MVNQLVDELRIYARQNGLSSGQLAKMLGAHKDTVKRWLTQGKTHEEPSPANATKIRSFLSAKESSSIRSYPPMFSESGAASGLMEQQAMEVSQKGGEKKVILTDESIKRLLLPYKIVMDSIHGDIKLTKLEVDIIDTREFQRLRTLKQLGTAYLVYPCAVHTRFEHSLGTLAEAVQIMQKINSNPQREEMVEPKAELLIRLVALLHDIAYVPFGHELEDEAHLLEKHEERYEQLLGPGTTIGDILVNNLGTEIAREVIQTLKATGEAEVERLRYPFASDIVLNTVCADLLDYLKRDNYFTGLNETFGKRFMDYLVITRVASSTGKPAKRLAIKLEKKGMLRRDVMSEIVQLLRARYSLGEKVYYHHTKQITAAMISKAVYLSGLYKNPAQLCKMGDEELITKMEESDIQALKSLASSLRKRDIFKAVYWVSFESAKYKQPELVETLYRDPDKRAGMEAEIALNCSIDPSDVIIYCPHSDMALKEAAVKVQWLDGITRPLNSIRDDPPRGEVDGIEAKHYALWRFCILLRASLIDRKGQELSDVCFHRWYMLNENPRYRIPGWDQSFKTLWQLGMEESLAAPEMEQLREVAHLDKSGPPQTVDGWRELLQNLRTQTAKHGTADS